MWRRRRRTDRGYRFEQIQPGVRGPADPVSGRSDRVSPHKVPHPLPGDADGRLERGQLEERSEQLADDLAERLADDREHAGEADVADLSHRRQPRRLQARAVHPRRCGVQSEPVGEGGLKPGDVGREAVDHDHLGLFDQRDEPGPQQGAQLAVPKNRGVLGRVQRIVQVGHEGTPLGEEALADPPGQYPTAGFERGTQLVPARGVAAQRGPFPVHARPSIRVRLLGRVGGKSRDIGDRRADVGEGRRVLPRAPEPVCRFRGDVFNALADRRELGRPGARRDAGAGKDHSVGGDPVHLGGNRRERGVAILGLELVDPGDHDGGEWYPPADDLRLQHRQLGAAYPRRGRDDQ